MKVMGIDVGRYKTASAVRGREGSILSTIGVVPITSGSYSRGSDDLDTITIINEETEVTWLIGADALTYSPSLSGAGQVDDWFDTLQFEALLCAAMSEVCDGSVDVNIVTGLPIERFGELSDSAGPLIKGKHVFRRRKGRKQTVFCERVTTVLQPMGPMADFILNSEGGVRNKTARGGVVGVADIGAETQHLFAVNEMNEIGKWTHGYSLGLLDALDNIARTIANDFPGIKPDAKEVSKWLRTGYKDIPMARYAKRFLDPLSDIAIGNINALWKEPKRFDFVVLAGGGCGPEILGTKLFNQMPLYDRVIMYDNAYDASMSIVRGLLKLGHYIWR